MSTTRGSVATEARRSSFADIRTRRWTKQSKVVGHITLLKWVPDQEQPTQALQQGALRKAKGRKRHGMEGGRMTRSVRQHLDAPLELLNEYPPTVRHSTRSSSVAPTVTPSATPSAEPTPVATPTSSVEVASTTPVSAPASVETPGEVPSDDALMALASDALFADTVASEEQLERALEDLPFLDADNLAMDPALALNANSQAPAPTSRQPPSIEEEKVDSAEDDDDRASTSSSSPEDDGDDEGNDSVISVSPLPSRSPSPSPMASPSAST